MPAGVGGRAAGGARVDRRPPTGYFGAVIAEVTDGDVVAVWGCGPVGHFATLSAFQRGASRVIAVDHHADRLERARGLGAEVINFDEVDPVQAIMDLTRGIGPDRAIDAVGVDAESPKSGPCAQKARQKDQRHREEVSRIAPETHPRDGQWTRGDAPTQVHAWAVNSIAKAGTLAIIGVYPPTDKFFPIGTAMNENRRRTSR